MMVILVIVMKYESYVIDLVPPLMLMISFPILWNDELYLSSWLGKSWYDLYDWCELYELYAIEKICVLCKMNKVVCMLIPLKC